MSALPPGVTAASTVQLNVGQLAFLAALRQRVPSSVPIYVTSGTRSVAAQAAAMFAKYQSGGEAALRAVYPDSTVALVMSAAPNPLAWAAAIANTAVSRHLRGDAVDIRSRDLRADQVAAIMSAAQSLGARALHEDDPPHIHLERLGSASGTSGGLLPVQHAKRAPGAALALVGGGITVGAILLLLFYRRSRR